MRRPFRLALVAFAVCGLVALALIACADQESPPSPPASPTPAFASGWRAQAELLLDQHGLQSAGEPQQVSHGRLRKGDIAFEQVAAASASIGLDLAGHAGEKASWFTVPLEAAGPDAPTSATFVVLDGELIGAAAIVNADPGVVSLDAAGT